MLSLNEILDFLNNKKDTDRTDPTIYRWRQVYYGMSLHIDGIKPAYRDLRYGVSEVNAPWITGMWGYPTDFRYYQDIFELQLFSKYPTEPVRTRQYRFSQYKPFTKEPFQQSIKTITGALFQDTGYSILVDDKDDNEYIWGNNFHGKNLAAYLSEKFQNICADPNGIFVVIPKESAAETTTSKVEPDIYFIPSKDILRLTKDEVLFTLNDIAWAINGIGYFRYRKQDGNKYALMEPNGYYIHMLRHTPHVVAGGQWNMQGFFDSWLDAAKALADEFVSAKSDEQLVMKEASFPVTIEASTDCPDCDGGTVQQCTKCESMACECGVSHEGGSNYRLTNCKSCGGTGDKARNPGDRMLAPADEMDKDLIKIISPNVDINKLHIERNKEIYNGMLRALYLNYIEQAQSGVAKDKDMETRYQFYSKIADDVFDRLIPQLLDLILGLRNVTSQNGELVPTATKYNIVKPTQFNIYTSYDLLTEYKEATESKIPSYQLTAILDDFVDKRFGGNDVLKRKTQLIGEMDILATKADEQIAIALLNNAATPRDYQFHLRLPLFLDQLQRDKGDAWFLGSTFDVIKSEVDKLFNLISPPAPIIPTQRIDETRINA